MDTESWIEESLEFDDTDLDPDWEPQWYWDDDTQTLYRVC